MAHERLIESRVIAGDAMLNTPTCFYCRCVMMLCPHRSQKGDLVAPIAKKFAEAAGESRFTDRRHLMQGASGPGSWQFADPSEFRCVFPRAAGATDSNRVSTSDQVL